MVEDMSAGSESLDEEAGSLHDEDVYAWANAQAAALRGRRFSDLDIPNLIDEVGSIAQSELDRLQDRLERLTHQILLWDFRPAYRSRSRAATIRNQRLRVERVLKRSPSLLDRREAILRRVYTYGRFAALREADDLPIASLPVQSPYSWEDVMERTLDTSDAPGTAG